MQFHDFLWCHTVSQKVKLFCWRFHLNNIICYTYEGKSGFGLVWNKDAMCFWLNKRLLFIQKLFGWTCIITRYSSEYQLRYTLFILLKHSEPKIKVCTSRKFQAISGPFIFWKITARLGPCKNQGNSGSAWINFYKNSNFS